MKEFLIKTGKQPCAVSFTITTDGSQVPVYIVGFDPFNPYSFYFRSRFQITGKEEVIMNCPQSPRFLRVTVWTEPGYSYQLPAVKKIPFEREPNEDPIIEFIEKFSRYAGVYSRGLYYGEAVPFVVDFRRDIYDDNGNIHPTPARISIEDPVIQVSQAKFRAMSIPERVIILLHEYSHNHINSDEDDEVEADSNGLSIYESLGYPKIEAMNAFAGIMADTDNNYIRMLNLVNR
jgi:hypothetical protein